MADKVIITCPKCPQKLHVPTGLGRLTVTCPVCRTKWDWQEGLQSVQQAKTVRTKKHPLQVEHDKREMWFKDDAGSVYYFRMGCYSDHDRPTEPAIYGIHAPPSAPVTYKWVLCEQIEKMTEIADAEIAEATTQHPSLAAELDAIYQEEMIHRGLGHG
jgi:hypothetical protein